MFTWWGGVNLLSVDVHNFTTRQDSLNSNFSTNVIFCYTSNWIEMMHAQLHTSSVYCLGYGLDDRVRFPVGAGIFCPRYRVQTGSRPTQSLVKWVLGFLFLK